MAKRIIFLLFALFYFSNFSCSYIEKKHQKNGLSFTITVFGDKNLVKNEILFTKLYFESLGINIENVFYRKGELQDKSIIVDEYSKNHSIKVSGINVMLVKNLREYRKSKKFFSGFSIKNRTDFCSPVILLSIKDMKINTLVHELGHIFNLKHSKDKNNIMFFKADKNKKKISREQVFTIKNKISAYKVICGNVF